MLKQAALSILPKEIVYRPKGLFSAPLRAWIRPRPGRHGGEVVDDGVLVTSGFLQRERKRMVADDAPAQQDRAQHLWPS